VQFVTSLLSAISSRLANLCLYLFLFLLLLLLFPLLFFE